MRARVNKIPLPQYDDALAFDRLSRNLRLSSYPTLLALVAPVQASYAQYQAVEGDPTLIVNVVLQDAVSMLSLTGI